MGGELKLGFHRLGRALEDPVNMGVAMFFAWAVVALTIAIGLTLSPGAALLVVFAGVAVAILLRRPIERGARRWHEGRIGLERDHPRFPGGA